MKITVIKRTEINGMVSESTVSATTDDYSRPDDLMPIASEEDPMPTDGELAAEIADKLFASINRADNPMYATNETGEAVLVS